MEFFAAEPNSCQVMDGGILFVSRSDGRPTGDAFVQFEHEEAGVKVCQFIFHKYSKLELVHY